MNFSEFVGSQQSPVNQNSQYVRQMGAAMAETTMRRVEAKGIKGGNANAKAETVTARRDNLGAMRHKVNSPFVGKAAATERQSPTNGAAPVSITNGTDGGENTRATKPASTVPTVPIIRIVEPPLPASSEHLVVNAPTTPDAADSVEDGEHDMREDREEVAGNDAEEDDEDEETF